MFYTLSNEFEAYKDKSNSSSWTMTEHQTEIRFIIKVHFPQTHTLTTPSHSFTSSTASVCMGVFSGHLTRLIERCGPVYYTIYVQKVLYGMKKMGIWRAITTIKKENMKSNDEYWSDVRTYGTYNIYIYFKSGTSSVLYTTQYICIIWMLCAVVVAVVVVLFFS